MLTKQDLLQCGPRCKQGAQPPTVCDRGDRFGTLFISLALIIRSVNEQPKPPLNVHTYPFDSSLLIVSSAQNSEYDASLGTLRDDLSL